MNRNEKYPAWFLWLWERGIGIFLVFAAIVMLLGIGIAVYVDGRLDRIETQLDYMPPRDYSPPNLADYQAKDVSPQQFSLRKSVYVPVYSHIYHDGGSPCLLETTLNIRNVDRDQPIYINRVAFFDTRGKLAKAYVDRTIKIGPLETIAFLVERRDTSGGSGANFLVEWMADDDIDRPLIESVMVGSEGTRGYCFARAGIELD